LSNILDSNDQVAILTELGLSSSQAKLFLMLAKSKSLTAKVISVVSSVSRPDVYRVMAELQEIGLVEKLIAVPEEFQAVSIEEAVSILLRRRIKKTEDLQRKGLDLVRSLNQKTEVEIAPKCEFILIPNKQSGYLRSERALKATSKSIYFLVSPRRMLAWLNEYGSSLEALLAKGVICKMLFPKSEVDVKLKDFASLRKFKSFELRISDKSPKASFTVWDEKEVLLITSVLDSAFPIATLWSNNAGLINLCLDYFDCLWEKATKKT
jgi:sugar-specific transcriptional regulator TrmB